jgi:site-specific recombinase XerD
MKTELITTGLQLNLYLDTCIEQFLNAKESEGRSTDTLSFYREKLTSFFYWCDKNSLKDISQVTPSDLRSFLLYLKQSNHNDGGISIYYRSIRSLFNWVWNEYDLELKNPIQKIQNPKVEEKFLHAASLSEIEKLLATCENNFIGIRDSCILVCLLDSGMRRTEFAKLNLTDFDIVSGTIIIKHTKAKKIRKVHLAQQARKLIRKYLKQRTDNNPALWITDKQEMLSPHGLSEMIRRRSKLAGIDRLSPHCFRRGNAKLLNESMSLPEIQTYLGHSDIRTTRHYINLDDEEILNHHEKASPGNRLKIK